MEISNFRPQVANNARVSLLHGNLDQWLCTPSGVCLQEDADRQHLQENAKLLKPHRGHPSKYLIIKACEHHAPGARCTRCPCDCKLIMGDIVPLSGRRVEEGAVGRLQRHCWKAAEPQVEIQANNLRSIFMNMHPVSLRLQADHGRCCALFRRARSKNCSQATSATLSQSC